MAFLLRKQIIKNMLYIFAQNPIHVISEDIFNRTRCLLRAKHALYGSQANWPRLPMVTPMREM